MNCDVGEVTEMLENDQSSFSNLSVTSPTSQFIFQPLFRFSYVTSSSLNSPGEPGELILQTFRHFTYVTVHFPTLPSLYLRHSSFSNPSFASPTSQALHLIHLANQQSSFSNLSVTSPTSQLILQPSRRFTYVTAHSPTLPLLHLRHSSFSNPSFALHLIHLASQQSSFSNLSITLPTSQLILQPFRCFTYATFQSPTVLSLLLRKKLFT